MRAQAPQTTHHRSTAAARCGQPCMWHVAPKSTFPALRAIQQASQQQPCSSDSLSHSSSSRAGGTGDPLSAPHPVQQQQQQQEQPCLQQDALSSSLQLLPLVAAHQLWTTVHSLPVHAAETIPPEAVALFREFLVGCLVGGALCCCLQHACVSRYLVTTHDALHACFHVRHILWCMHGPHQPTRCIGQLCSLLQ
jgi:hypothetical protein